MRRQFTSEILDLGQTGVNGSGWGWERLEIKNTGTEAWHIKSISELNDFTLEPFDYPFQEGFNGWNELSRSCCSGYL